jgi:dimethylhistidine N-methyltransferase
MLRSLGRRVRVAGDYDRPADLVVALHAKKSAAAIARAHADGATVVVALTGTDLYKDIAARDAEALRSLDLAHRLVALQPRALESLAPEHRAKTRVILQSVRVPQSRTRLSGVGFTAATVGHLRAVKDSLLAAEAARRLPASSRWTVLHAGGAIEPELGERARYETEHNPRYHWVGELPRSEALALIAGADVLIHPSRLEGGANVIGEAVACGVPVLATRIDGSVGLLGADYPGYFEPGDPVALAALLERCEREPAFVDDLRRRIAALQPSFAPERERAAWAALLAELPRARIVTCAAPAVVSSDFAADVRAGLARAPKRLPCRYFYDAAGSLLFERICEQPEYYIPRVEQGILATHADAIIAACPPRAALCELGSGNAHKTRLLIEAALAKHGRCRYAAVDISRDALDGSARGLCDRYEAFIMLGVVGEYAAALPELWRRVPPPRLVLWLGSNIGNFDRAGATEFLARVAAQMTERDRLLVGFDHRKPRAVLERAYDDAAGVTAAFNKNLLARMNTELGADFDLAAFDHRASYDERDGRVDMHLVSKHAHTVHILGAALDVSFAAGEAIHTESSYKHDAGEIAAMAARAGLAVVARYTDAEGLFSEQLLRLATG